MRTWVMLGALAGLALLAGAWAAGPLLAVVYVAAALLVSALGYWGNDRAVLRAAGARPIAYWEAPGLHAAIGALAARAGIPAPRLYLAPGQGVNAFAVGRSPGRAALAVTAGLLRALPDDELVAVLAHETAHLRHRDPLLALVGSGLAGAATWAAQVSLFTWLAGVALMPAVLAELGPGSVLLQLALIAALPAAALALRMALSREREHAADAGAARLTGDPLALARALERMARLEWQRLGVWHWLMPHGPVPPADAAGGLVAGLFRSHPPTAERVARLVSLAGRHVPARIRYGAYPAAF